MTLERIEHKVFASEAPLDEMGQFGSALATTKLNTKDVAEIQALPAYTKGWGSAIISENNYPAMEEMNGVLNVMSYHTGYLYQEGIPVYSANQTYSATSWVKDLAGKDIYKSKKDNNIGNDLNDSEWFERVDFGGNSLKTNQITNCLLEVPQNINLELNDGTLTLKAGSKVIVPNGSGVFDEVTVEKDISIAKGYNDKRFIFLNASKNGLHFEAMTHCQSGASPAGLSYSYQVWYDTSNNLVKISNDGGSTWSTGGNSLPICAVTTGDGVISSIDQVFNGFGYIGSTIWVDKGVKGLIPNGRNEDGSLKNTEYTTSKVLTINMLGSSPTIVSVNPNGTLTSSLYYIEQKEQPTGGQTLWYKPSENIMSRISANGTLVRPFNAFIIATNDCTNGVISNFQPKLPVRLLTYDDIKINNPYFFGQYIWSEFAPDNLSWLKSSGQWNSGNGYQAFYNWVLSNANANKAGFKLSTASYTDYDFVVNTSAKTFRLPNKVKGNMGEAVIGNGMALGVTDGQTQAGVVTTQTGLTGATGSYGANLGVNYSGTFIGNSKTWGITTDPTKSGLILDNTGLSLYFYVGETVRDEFLIDVAQIASNFADKIGRTECKAYITQTYVNGTSGYRIWSDKFCEQWGRAKPAATNNGTTEVTLLKAYENTNGMCLVTSPDITFMSGGGINYGTSSAKFIANNKIRVKQATGSPEDSNIQWYTTGYLA